MFEIVVFTYGPNIEVVKSGFARGSAALAWLLDDLASKGFEVYYDADPVNPGCYDLIAVLNGVAFQYAINKTE